MKAAKREAKRLARMFKEPVCVVDLGRVVNLGCARARYVAWFEDIVRDSSCITAHGARVLETVRP